MGTSLHSLLLISLCGGLLIALVVILWRWRSAALERIRIAAELRRVQAELLERQRQWEAITEEKIRLMSLLSHDLKGPFNRIFALVQLINFSASNLTEEQEEYVSKIHQVAADGLGMIRNLLDTRKLETKALEFRPEPIELADFLSGLLKSFEPIAEKKSISLSLEEAKPLSVIGDRQILQRVFENLISNAVKFSPIPSAVRIGYARNGGRVETWIADQGPGISPEDQPKLFKKFQTLSTRPTGGESATGLGLSVVKAMSEKMGGTVRYESGPKGRGSRFVVSLPG